MATTAGRAERQGEADGGLAEAADAEHRDRLRWLEPPASKRVKGGGGRAHHDRRLGGGTGSGTRTAFLSGTTR